MVRFLFGFWLGISLAFLAGFAVIDVLLSFPSRFESPGDIGRSAGFALLVGLVVTLFFSELDGHGKSTVSMCAKHAPSRPWFWWGAGAGAINGALILLTVAILTFIADRIPFLADRALMVMFGSGLLAAILFGGITQTMLSKKVLKVSPASEAATAPGEEKADLFESLRPGVAGTFVVLWTAPVLYAFVRGEELGVRFDVIVGVQVFLLALAGVVLRLSRRVQMRVFRPGITLEDIRQGCFAINLWIVLAAAFAIFLFAGGRL